MQDDISGQKNFLYYPITVLEKINRNVYILLFGTWGDETYW
jgi:hypothetical protein